MKANKTSIEEVYEYINTKCAPKDRQDEVLDKIEKKFKRND